MRATRVLRAHYQPLIKFVGKRHQAPAKVDHTPHAHPASPTHSLPESFASYRGKAQSHGPLGGGKGEGQQLSPTQAIAQQHSGNIIGRVGASSGRNLGSIEPKEGQVFDRDELPQRFRRTPWSLAEMEAIDSGGATSILAEVGAVTR